MPGFTPEEILKSGQLEVGPEYGGSSGRTPEYASGIASENLSTTTSASDLKERFSEFEDARSDSEDDDSSEESLSQVERLFSYESGNVPGGSDPSTSQDHSTMITDSMSSTQSDQYVRMLLGEQASGGVVRRYEGWLGKSVLLQGKFYLTNRYLLFHAPLLPPAIDTVRASPLSKKSAQMLSVIGRAGYSRHWFVLRMGSFAWYGSSADIYAPQGVIPLHVVESVEIDEKAPSKFILRSQFDKSYSFKADSRNTAHEWVKVLKKEVFKARNKNDRPAAVVRIPLENIIATDEEGVLDLGRRLNLKALSDKGEQSVTHEADPASKIVVNYTFAFFGEAKEVSQLGKQLATLTNDFANHAGAVIENSPHTGGRVVNLQRSQFGHVNEAILDTTPSANMEIHAAIADDSDVQTYPADPGSANKGDTSNHSLFHLNTPLFGSGSNTPRSKAATPKESLSPSISHSNSKTHMHHLSKPFSKINVLGSLHHKLHHLTVEDKEKDSLENSSSVKINPFAALTSSSSTEVEDESDNDDDADSDYDGTADTDASDTAKLRISQGIPVLPDTPNTSVRKMTLHCDSASSAAAGVQEKVISDKEEIEALNEWFRDHFGLDRDSVLHAEYLCSLINAADGSTWSGRLLISNNFLCFHRKNTSSRRYRMVIPLKDIIHLTEAPAGARTMSFEVAETAYGVLKLSFSDASLAHDAQQELEKAMSHCSRDPNETTRKIDDESEARFLEYSLRTARLTTYEPTMSARLKQQIPPLMFDPTSTQFKEAFLQKPMESMKFAMMMIGSRGDVQPYIALSQGLMAEGHKCMIMSHKEFRPWVESYGIEFREIAGDPSELMEIMISHGSISYGFVRDALHHFKNWMKELMKTSWHQIRDANADVLIESPSSMIGIHLAEALNIPYYRAFTMPWTRTKAYPQALISNDQNKGGAYNSFTYMMYDRLVWFGISKYVNRWRKHDLNLPETSLDLMRQEDVPFLYCVSPTVLVPPLDQFDWVHSCGYWEVREKKDGSKKDVDPKVEGFIAKARSLNKKIAYIGFGSIIVSDPDAMTNTVVEATKASGVYCILARGWSSRSQKKEGKEKEKKPIKAEHVCEVDSIDHQWLFPQMDVCVHHGGSGTTGASLRAGKPTIIKPFFGDQFFYASRVEDLNVGQHLKKMNTEAMSAALTKCITDQQLIRQAAVVGEQISHEHGVEEAILAIYRELVYAKDVTLRRRKQTKEDAENGILTDAKSLLPGKGKHDGDDSWFSLPKFGRREEARRHSSSSGEVDVSL